MAKKTKGKEIRLKTWPVYFQAVQSGSKTFELRKNDRDFQVGDTIVLREYIPAQDEYTGNSVKKKIAYILWGTDGDFGISSDYCVICFEEDSHRLNKKISELKKEMEALRKNDIGAAAKLKPVSDGLKEVSKNMAASAKRAGDKEQKKAMKEAEGKFKSLATHVDNAMMLLDPK